MFTLERLTISLIFMEMCKIISSNLGKIGKINFAPCLENVLRIARSLLRKVLFSVGILCGPKATVEQAAQVTLYQPALLKVICLQSTCFQSTMK